MATDLPTSSRSGGGSDIASLLTALSGIFGSKSQTTTRQTKLDQNTLNAMLQRAMEENSGLASMLGGQRRAGIYNSSTANLLTNDFMSRLATDVAMKGAPTVETSKQPAMIDPLLGLGGLLALQAMSPAGLGGIFGGKGAEATTMSNPVGTLMQSLGVGGATGNAVTSPGMMSFTRPNGLLDAGGLMQAGEMANTINNGMNFAQLGSPVTALSMSPTTTLDMAFAANPLEAVERLNRTGGELVTSAMGADGALNFANIPWTAGLSGLMQGDLGGAIGGIGKSWLGAQIGNALTPVLGPFGAILGAIFGGLF